MADFKIRLDRKSAKKLYDALCKGTFEKLTPAEMSALDDLITDLAMEFA